jgi:hypothetical protein
MLRKREERENIDTAVSERMICILLKFCTDLGNVKTLQVVIRQGVIVDGEVTTLFLPIASSLVQVPFHAVVVALLLLLNNGWQVGKGRQDRAVVQFTVAH